MLLLISYDLSTADRPANYAQIEASIRAAAIEVFRPLYSEWLVVTSETVDQWSERLKPFLTTQDRLLIVRVQGRANGWLPPSYWAWINEHAS